MKENNYSFSHFVKVAFPEIDPFRRKEFGFFHNLIKWCAIRIAFVFFRLGITANVIDLCGLLLLVPCYYLLYISINENNLLIFVVSYFGIFFVLSIDFMDGVLARAFNEKNMYGDLIDDLSPEIIRFISLIVIGYLSQNAFIFILSALNAILQQTFVASTLETIKNKNMLLLLRSRYSLHSIRLLSCILVPFCCFLFIVQLSFINILIGIYVLFNFLLNLTWIYLSLQNKSLR